MITREKLLQNETYLAEMLQNKIYNDLVRYIEENKLTQKEIAEKLSVSKGYVSQILNGTNLNFRISTLVKICLAIGKVPNIEFEDIEEFINKDKLDQSDLPTIKKTISKMETETEER
ncbi:MAG: helix-turn-helix domain-containing protein [Bacteroidales bacterium]|nr:helix-turn-helix domain-containing protein [Bacteroidales bacterium]